MIHINMKKLRGFISAQDVILSIAVGALVTIGLLKYEVNATKWATYAGSANQVKTVGEAANEYVSNHFMDFIKLRSATLDAHDLGPRTCVLASQNCYFDETTLINEGYLPKGYKPDLRSGGFIGVVNRVATVPNAILKGLLISKNEYGVSPILSPGIANSKVTFDANNDLMEVVQNAGVDAGYAKGLTTTVSAQSPWGWNFTIPFSATDAQIVSDTTKTRLIYRIGFGASHFNNDTDYMQLNGSTPMQASLNMGGNSIYGANTIRPNTMTASKIAASTVLTVNKEGNGTIYNGTTAAGNVPLYTGSQLKVGSTTFVGSTSASLGSTINSQGPFATMDRADPSFTTGNTYLDSPTNTLNQVNAQAGLLQEGFDAPAGSRAYGINVTGKLSNYDTTVFNSNAKTPLIASKLQAGNMTANLTDDSSTPLTVANIDTKALVKLRDLRAPQIYAIQQGTNTPSLTANSYTSDVSGAIQMADPTCVNTGSSTKCGSNLVMTGQKATFAAGSSINITNVQVPYSTCSSSDGSFFVTGMLAKSRDDPTALLSCTDIISSGTGRSGIWVPVSKAARTYTYIGKTSINCPTGLKMVTGGSSCASSALASPGSQTSTGWAGATCASGGQADVVIVCRY